MTKRIDITASRRRILTAGLAVIGGMAALATQARADDKLDPKLVQYRTTPGDDGSVCSKCVNFEAPNACKIVAGDIAPTGWCVAFAPKES